jgi:hypothetical protein
MSDLIFNKLELNRTIVDFVNHTINSTIKENNNISNTTTTTSNIFFIAKIAFIIFILSHLIYLIYALIKINCFNRDSVNNVKKLNEECSICLDTCKNEVQLLCSHSFCGKCLTDFIHHENLLSSMDKIKCPYCRVESKFIVIQFEENNENKEYYDILQNYNDKVTAQHKTSLCLCVDIFKYSILMLKKILNLRDDRYLLHRKILTLVVLIIFLVSMIYVQNHVSGSTGEIIQDIIFYIVFILVIAEAVYRRIRRQNRAIFELNLRFGNHQDLEHGFRGGFNQDQGVQQGQGNVNEIHPAGNNDLGRIDGSI